MQQHRDVGCHYLVCLAVPALPPAVDLELKSLILADDRQVGAVAFAEVDKLFSLAQKVGGNTGGHQIGNSEPYARGEHYECRFNG